MTAAEVVRSYLRTTTEWPWGGGWEPPDGHDFTDCNRAKERERQRLLIGLRETTADAEVRCYVEARLLEMASE